MCPQRVPAAARLRPGQRRGSIKDAIGVRRQIATPAPGRHDRAALQTASGSASFAASGTRLARRRGDAVTRPEGGQASAGPPASWPGGVSVGMQWRRSARRVRRRLSARPGVGVLTPSELQL